MENENVIILKSVYSRTPQQSYFIQPAVDPETQDYPDCVRERDVNGSFILSEKDKLDRSNGKVFIGKNDIIEVKHGQTFDLNIPVQKATWEAIKNSMLIAPDRLAKDSNGDYVIDGEKPYRTDQGLILGKQGLADLYVYHQGYMSKVKNTTSRLIFKAKEYIYKDTIEGWISKAKLLEKDLSKANINDIEAYMIDQAEKYPEKVIDLYTGTTTSIRLLLVTALDKKVIVKKSGLLIYADEIVLGANLDSAVTYLANPDNIGVKELIQKETFPDLYKKKTPLELAREAKDKKKSEENKE